MKKETICKWLSLMLVICLSITTFLFYNKWQAEKQDQSELEQLCHNSVQWMVESLTNFQKEGYESNYWDAVANFHMFRMSYSILKGQNDPTISAIYDVLSEGPQKTPEDYNLVIEKMKKVESILIGGFSDAGTIDYYLIEVRIALAGW